MKGWIKISGRAELKQWHSHAIQTMREISCNRKNDIKYLRLKIKSWVHLHSSVSPGLVALYKVSTSACNTHIVPKPHVCAFKFVFCLQGWNILSDALAHSNLLVLKGALWRVSFTCWTTAVELHLAHANCYVCILFHSHHIHPLWMLRSGNCCENQAYFRQSRRRKKKKKAPNREPQTHCSIYCFLTHGLSEVRHKPGQKEKNPLMFSLSSGAGLKA